MTIRPLTIKIFELGNRVAHMGTGDRGTVGTIPCLAPTMIPIIWDDSNEKSASTWTCLGKMEKPRVSRFAGSLTTALSPVNELEILECDVGHCHGCQRLQTLQMVKVEVPLRKTGSMFRWDCKHCGFRNAEFNVMKAVSGNPHSLECLTCSQRITPVRTGKQY